MRRARVLTFLFLLTLLLISAGVDTASLVAQVVDVCPAFISQALETVGNNCSGINRNSGCYGYNTVQASFLQPQSSGFFTTPSDRAELSTLSRIATNPMQTDLNEWGIALMSVQANLPDALPGQSVIFMLAGDTEVENAVAPEDVFMPGAILELTTQSAAVLSYQPSADSTTIIPVPAGSPVTADAISADSAWARVVYNESPGWLPVSTFAADTVLSDLSVFSATSATPMQAFYFRTSPTDTECSDAPDSLIIQGPQGLQVDFTANGADIRIGSTVVLRTLDIPADLERSLAEQYQFDQQVFGLMEVITLDGEAILNPDTPQEEIVPAGYRAQRCLTAPENLGTDGIMSVAIMQRSGCRYVSADDNALEPADPLRRPGPGAHGRRGSQGAHAPRGRGRRFHPHAGGHAGLDRSRQCEEGRRDRHRAHRGHPGGQANFRADPAVPSAGLDAGGRRIRARCAIAGRSRHGDR